MGNRAASQRVAKRRIQRELAQIEVFLRDWDALGVSKDPGRQAAPGEYNAFAPSLHTLLREGGTLDVLTAHLRQIRVNKLGVEPDAATDARIAQRLVAWWTEAQGT